MLADARRESGPDHPDTLTQMHRLAADYIDAKEWPQAIALGERTLERREATLGPGHADTFASLTLLYRAYEQAGVPDRKEHVLREILEFPRREAHARTAEVAAGMAALGQDWLNQGRYAEAEQILRECVAIREEEMAGSWGHFNALSLLGGALLGQGNHAAAEPLLLRGYEGLKKQKATIPAPAVGRVPEALGRIIRLYEATNQPEKARRWRADP
jgi:hypothetical protein